MKQLIILLLALSLPATAALQTCYFVAAAATGNQSGQSWADAFTDLQQALTVAVPGDEVWVAEGVYCPTNGADRLISFRPASGVRLYGGFSGTESALSQRNWEQHPTVLSGDIGAPGDSLDNSLNVVYLLMPDSNTVLDGFTITLGVANDELSSNDVRDRYVSGGGLYVDGGNWEAMPNVANCRFYRNSAAVLGGAVMLMGTNDAAIAPRFESCRFEQNRALGSGGAVLRLGGSWVERGLEFKDCTFSENQAGMRGGALYYIDTEGPNKIGFESCLFEKNQAVTEGGNTYFTVGKQNIGGLSFVGCEFIGNSSHKGAAIRVIPNGSNFDGQIIVDDCSFRNCTVPIDYLLFDVFMENESFFQLSNSKFDAITSGVTVSLELFPQPQVIIDKVQISNCKTGNIFNGLIHQLSNSMITGNSISGILNTSSSSDVLFFENNLLANNYTENINSDLVALFGVSIFKKAFIRNNIIGDFVGKKLIDAQNLSNLDTLYLHNNHFQDSLDFMPKSITELGSTVPVILSHNSFQYINCAAAPPNTFCGPGNLSGLTPLFRDTAAGDYRLLPCSPLIDAGSNAVAIGLLTDIDGAPRIQGGTVDIGPYEAGAFAQGLAAEVLPACEGSPGGSITLHPENGCEPLIYNWEPNIGNGPQANDLPPGEYAVTVTDQRGRAFSDTLTVATAPSPEVGGFTTDVQCGNPLGGTAAAIVSNGTAPYSFLWNTAATDSLITMLPPGQYTVTATDALGCTDSTRMFVFLNGFLTLMVDGEAISCYGQTDGQLSAAAANGLAPFSYAWSPALSADSLQTNLGPGQYIITVTDFYGCTASFTFNLSEPQLLGALAFSTATNNLQTPNGTATATATGGTPAYTYAWSTGATTQALTDLPAGVYTVTITDGHGCTATASTEVLFMVSTTTPESAVVKVWPNPATTHLNFELPATATGRVYLYDAAGRLVLSAPVSDGRAVAAVGALPAGVYLWRWMGIGGLVRLLD